MLTLYHWDPNANSGKPMLALAEKGVEYRSHYLEAFVPGAEPSRWG
jgi:GST-like protein